MNNQPCFVTKHNISKNMKANTCLCQDSNPPHSDEHKFDMDKNPLKITDHCADRLNQSCVMKFFNFGRATGHLLFTYLVKTHE